MPGSRLLSSLVLSLALVFAVAGCATNTEGESGSLSLALVINGDTEIDEVQWSITRGGEEVKSGTINTSANGATASVEAYGLEPGDGYTITLEAASPEKEATCKGSAMFDIKVGEVTEVDVMMNCKPPRRFGAVRVNGELNICPYVNWADVSPLETSVGNDIDLFAMATDDDEGDTITYMWSSGSGIIADPMAQRTTYTCTEVVDDVIFILVTDDGGTHCMDMHTVPIECVAGDGEPCEGVICEDTGNECTTAACNSGTGFCETSNVADNTDCDGGAGMCMGGECVPKELCMDVFCEDDGNECTDEACNPADGMCETSNNTNACNDDTGTCSEGVCVPNPECAVDGDCPATGNECIDAVCNAGTCGTSNNTNACDGGDGTCDAGVCVPNPECAVDGDCPATGNECIDPVCNAGTCGTSNNTNACDGGNGTCDGQGVCVPNPECSVPDDCPATGNECIDPVCNAGVCETSNNTNACEGGTGTCNAGVCVPNEVCEYTQDFELLTLPPPQFPPNSLSNDGWLVGGNEFESDGTFFNGYFAFPAPNGGPAFSAVVAGQGGAAQGAQQMSIYNDYNNSNHGDGPPDLNRIIEAVVFQERDIEAADVGNTISYTFDAKAGNIEGASTAEAFIQVLDQVGGSFAVLADDVEVTTGFSTWQENITLSVPIDASLVGQLLQFGGRSRASNFEGSGVFYDNMSVCSAPTP